MADGLAQARQEVEEVRVVVGHGRVGDVWRSRGRGGGGWVGGGVPWHVPEARLLTGVEARARLRVQRLVVVLL